MPDYCADSRSAAHHHTSGSARGSRLGLQAWELISKSAEIRAEFRKTTVSTPPKSTKRDRSGYLTGRGGRGREAVAATQSLVHASKGVVRRERES